MRRGEEKKQDRRNRGGNRAFNRLRKEGWTQEGAEESRPQGLKPTYFVGLIGTTHVVP